MAKPLVQHLPDGSWQQWDFELGRYTELSEPPPGSELGEDLQKTAQRLISLLEENRPASEPKSAGMAREELIQVAKLVEQAGGTDVPLIALNCIGLTLVQAMEIYLERIWPALSAKFAKRGKTGWAAAKHSWLHYWDDSWAERRENDKGWKVSNKEVYASLPTSVEPPERSVLTRHRMRRYKERNT